MTEEEILSDDKENGTDEPFVDAEGAEDAPAEGEDITVEPFVDAQGTDYAPPEGLDGTVEPFLDAQDAIVVEVAPDEIPPGDREDRTDEPLDEAQNNKDAPQGSHSPIPGEVFCQCMKRNEHVDSSPVESCSCGCLPRLDQAFQG